MYDFVHHFFFASRFEAILSVPPLGRRRNSSAHSSSDDISSVR